MTSTINNTNMQDNSASLNGKLLRNYDPMLQWGREKTSKMPGGEIVSERTGSKKVFAFGGNRYQAVLFPENVHFKDADGHWKDIDNTLVPADAEGRTVYESRNGAWKIRLAGSADAAPAVSIADGTGTSIAWQYLSAGPVPLSIDDVPIPETDDEDVKRSMLPGFESSARYVDVYPSVDIVCRLRGSEFKDEMILKDKNALRIFRIGLETEGLLLEQDADGTVYAMRDGKPVFELPPAFLMDAEGNSGKVDTSLSKENGRTVMVLKCDDAFLESAAYPVLLDPTVRSARVSSLMEDNYVTSNSPDTVRTHTASTMKVANSPASSNGICYAYIKHKDLPQIRMANTITKAYLTVTLGAYQASAVNIGLHEVTGSWSSQTITYNNRPSYESRVLDLVTVSGGTQAGKKYEFDISNLVRKWYRNGQLTNNNGVMLRSLNDTVSSSNNVVFYSSDMIYQMPVFTVNYVANAGLFDYTEYDSHNAGRAGAGHVNLHNGNLILSRSLTETGGTRMPVSLGLYYNSCNSEADESDAIIHDDDDKNIIDETRFTAADVGRGWKLSCDRFVRKQKINNATWYMLEDGDGSRHWFKNPGSSGGYDESGLRMKMTIGSTNIKVEDTQGVVSRFELASNYGDTGRILSVTDPVGNAITYTYTSGKLTKLTDGAGRETALSYGNNGKVSSVTTPDSVTAATFAYSGDLLQAVTDLGTGSSVYSYNNDGLLTAVELKPEANNAAFIQSALRYTYTSDRPYRVATAVSEGMKSGTGTAVQGASVAYTYGDCMTTVTDNSSPDGKKLIYNFNDYGNVAAVQDELGYAKFASYTDTSLPNRATEVSRIQRSVVNLLPNHNFEDTSDTNWTAGLENGATGTHSYATDQKKYGTRSVKMAKTNGVGAMTRSITVDVESGKTYSFSGYARTSGDARCIARAVSGAVSVTGTPVSSADDWTRVSVTFTAAASAAVLSFMTGEEAGNVWVDCAQLEEGSVVNRYNMVLNGDFSRYDASTGKPEDWTDNTSNTASDGVVDVSADALHPSYLSDHALHLYGTPDKLAGMTQVIAVSGSKNDVFSVGGWAKGYSRPIRGTDGRYCLRLSFSTSASGSWTAAEHIDWNEEWTDWHYASGAVIAPINYNYVRVEIGYKKNVNEAWFDGICLYKEEFGRSYAYDSNGNITDAKTLAGNKAHAIYDSYNNMTSYRQPGRSSSEKYTLNYGSDATAQKKRLLLKETSPMGVINQYEYDEFGNQKKARTRNSGGTLMIQATQEYSSDGNHVTKEIDARGLETTTCVNTATDLVNSVTHPNEQAVAYTYDNMKRMTGVTATVGEGNTARVYSNEYVYEHDMLKQVKHNTSSGTCDVIYAFDHDDLGRQTAVSVRTGSGPDDFTPLSTNHYNAGTQTLHDVTFGNGGKVQYGYDGFKRVTGVRYDNDSTDRFAYGYSTDGRIGRISDNHLGRQIWNEYDLADRPARLHVSDGAGNILYRTKLGYDEYNNLSSFSEETEDGGTFTTTYTYDMDNRPTAVQFGSNTEKVAYSYDALGRIATRTQYNGSSTPANTAAYSYLSGGQTQEGYTSTTPLISAIAQDGVSFSYGYAADSNNIVSENRTGGNYAGQTTYEYDTLDQLVRVNDPKDLTEGANGTTWIYAYDCGGNMTSKIAYPYTTGTLAGSGSATGYTYSSNWKDQLTAVGSTALRYDSIGNLTNDGSWEYTWEAGRQLKRQVKAQGSSVGYGSVEYEYDHTGLRVRKTVRDLNGIDSSVYDYTYNGKMLTHLTCGNDSLHFFYDAQARPAMLSWNGTKYHYLYDLQSDVIGLVDTSGSVVVEYKYDAWGRIIGSTGSLATTLGRLNPFRYRGYVYDEETQMYYCRSRYYCPEIHRWISIDEDLAGGHKLLGRNLVVYSANNPTNCTDITGERTYFINGINNNTRKEGDGLLPQSAINFKKAYEALYDDDVVCIPVFVGGNTWSGISEVWQETIGNDVYTKYIVDMIRTDLNENPLRPGERITLVGYSGGGILAANTSTYLDHVDTIVFIGAPLFLPTVKADKKVYIFAGFDLLASIWFWDAENCFSGFHGHTGYFSEDNLLNTVNLVGSCSRSNKRKKGAGACR